MNLLSANQAKEFVHVTRRDESRRPVEAFVPGHQCKRYKLTVERDSEGLVVTCKEHSHYDKERDAWVQEERDCGGAQFGVCYHALAFLLNTTEKSGSCQFHDNKDDAEERASIQDESGIGVKVVKLQSATCPGKPVWVVFRPNSKPARTSLSDKPKPPPAQPVQATLIPDPSMNGGSGPYGHGH